MAESSRTRETAVNALEREDFERAEKRREEGRHILGDRASEDLQASFRRFEQLERTAKEESYRAGVLRQRIISEAKAAMATRSEGHLATVSLKGEPYEFTEVYTEFVPGSQRYFRSLPGGGINELHLSPNHDYDFKEWDPVTKEVRRFVRKRVPRARNRRIAPQASIGHRTAAIYGIESIKEQRRF